MVFYDFMIYNNYTAVKNTENYNKYAKKAPNQQ